MPKQPTIPATELDTDTLKEFVNRGVMAQHAVDRVLRKKKKQNGRAAPSSPRRRKFGQRQVKTMAFRVMAVIADLSPAQRTRVLEQAAKLNEV